MIKKRKKNLIVLLAVFLLASLLFLPSKSYAALQANGASTANYTINNWMLKVRQMEVIGGTLGKSETINTTSTDGNRLLPTTESNGLDCHMEKNSEYGALVLLSASAYGNPAKITDSSTTTGNVTGVVMKLNNEIVSAGTVTASPNYHNAHERYKDIYTNNYQSKKGDAITETAGWHGGTSRWISGHEGYGDGSAGYDNYFTIAEHAVLLRATGSVFGYDGQYSHRQGGGTRVVLDNAYSGWTRPSRAVVVVGEGF